MGGKSLHIIVYWFPVSILVTIFTVISGENIVSLQCGLYVGVKLGSVGLKTVFSDYMRLGVLG